MGELLPCPFCGASGDYYEEQLGMLKATFVPLGVHGQDRLYFVKCIRCDARGPGAANYRDVAIKRWNKREATNG
jgi:hypothetical protein